MPMALQDKEKQTGKNKHFKTSIYHAIIGIRTVFQEERNMRAHSLMALLAIILGIVLNLNRWEWLWLVLVIFLVFFAEICNTITENLVDLSVNKQFHPIAKKAKDMAAAGVLLTACFALIVGSILFLPKIIHCFFN